MIHNGFTVYPAPYKMCMNWRTDQRRAIGKLL